MREEKPLTLRTGSGNIKIVFLGCASFAGRRSLSILCFLFVVVVVVVRFSTFSPQSIIIK